MAVQVKARKAENYLMEINYYRRAVAVASFVVFTMTFFLIILLFRLISSLFVLLEYSFQSFKKLKVVEAKGKETRPPRSETSNDRRKYPRFDVYWPIEFNHIGSSVSHNGRVTNLSEGGMLFQSPGQIEIGQHLKSKLSFISGSKINIVQMRAEVVWKDIDSNRAKGNCRCGARFLDISAMDKNKLNTFLMSLSQLSPYPS